MDKDKSYTPVSCATHSEYELLIMHNDNIQLRWYDKNGLNHLAVVTAKDLQTKAGEEFLIIENNNGEQHQVRLDHIQDYQIV